MAIGAICRQPRDRVSPFLAGPIRIWQESSRLSAKPAILARIGANIVDVEMLDRHPKLNTDSFELSRHVHALLQLSLEPVDAKVADDRFHTIANAYETRDFTLFYFSYSRDVVLDAVAENPHYWLAVPIRTTASGASHRRISLQKGAARLASPGAADPLRLCGGVQSLGLCLKDHTIRNFAEPYFGEHLKRSIVFEPRFDIENTVDRTIGQMLAMIVEEEHVDASTFHDTRCTDRFVEAIVSTLLLHAPHSHSALLGIRAHAPAPRDVKRVIDYIQAYPHHAITLPLLVEISGVPGRTLNQHFRAFTGLPPMAYLTRVRLHRVRQAFLAGYAKNVISVAMEFGFHHPGRFARLYRKAFGEAPSETLAANRRH